MLGIFKKKKLDIEALIAGSVESLQLMNAEHRNNWHLGREQSWKVDEAEGRIVFTFADGGEVSAPVQVIGTFHVKNGTFMWGWDHPSVLRKLQKHAAHVKTFGEEYNCAEFTTAQVPCTEKRAWEYAALAMLLAEASGAYRARITPDTFVYMTFGEIEVTATAAA